ncbi:MFS transporter [Parabacteroides sp. FAFU027]|uniref:MFS transporter n=1 Tax=Parabacteroides sp. FAFU027 TaxID=2922715 RepID=UPI001FAFC5E2|nr:MFS transporter [Parabacteroides sp. FAFU027]
MRTKPQLSSAQIWNMSFGFLGIQAGFALQNANASRILQTFGADVGSLSWFWIVAPLTGMIIQPIIGHYSDHTWGRLGRRKPYFLAGALLAALALIFMPNSAMLSAIVPPLLVGAGMLTLMNASFNVAMEPFRALVADLLPDNQRTLGFSVQTFLIGVGAVIGSWLPFILSEWMDVDKHTPNGEVPVNVIISFYAGAAMMVGAIAWTIIKTKEYPPEIHRQFQSDDQPAESHQHKGLSVILKDIASMPKTMKELGIVQFFSWFALFAMWVYTTPAVAQHVYGTIDPNSEAYQKAGDWVGVLFGVYNLVAMFFALALPGIAARTNRKITHAISLTFGAAGLISIFFITNPYWLILSMVGIGIAWASILAMPYAILAGAIPPAKMGVYMGIFNFFITIPQIVSSLANGPIVKYVFHSDSMYAILMAGVCLLIAAVSVVFVQDKG